jgi:hypothetical protein
VEAEAAQKITRQQEWGKCAKLDGSVLCSVWREKYILPSDLSLYTSNYLPIWESKIHFFQLFCCMGEKDMPIPTIFQDERYETASSNHFLR